MQNCNVPALEIIISRRNFNSEEQRDSTRDDRSGSNSLTRKISDATHVLFFYHALSSSFNRQFLEKQNSIFGWQQIILAPALPLPVTSRAHALSSTLAPTPIDFGISLRDLIIGNSLRFKFGSKGVSHRGLTSVNLFAPKAVKFETGKKFPWVSF